MNTHEEQRALWRETLGEETDKLWQAFHEHTAPPLRVRFESRSHSRRWQLTAIAASLLAGISLLWGLQLSKELSATRDAYALALLQTDNSPAMLTALAQLPGDGLSANAIESLKTVVITARDPNVQLIALDLLQSNGALGDESDAADLLDRVRHNREFVAASLRAQTIRI